MVTMPIITPSMLAQRIAADPVAHAVQPPSADTISTFNTSLERAGEAAAVSPPALTAAQPEAQAPAAPYVVPEVGTEGDAILGGLQRLRSTFDAQQSRLAELMNGQVTDMDTMLVMQMELTNYSILIDMTSKLASKAAQGLDTLMKG
jgi:type III secretion system YscI/HrpB-like protein